MVKKKKLSISILEQLDEVSRMTDSGLNKVCIDENRPGIIKQYANAILTGEIADTLKIIKEVSKMDRPDAEANRKEDKSIEDLAIGDDDEAFYIALIQQNTMQLLRKNISPQETARLTQNLDIFRTKLREIRSRTPKANTTLAKVLAAASTGPKKHQKAKPTSVMKKTAASKAAGASKKKKMGKVLSGAKKCQ